MSPPCQPFTTTCNSSQRDVRDPRAASFLHLLALLPQLGPQQAPTHLLLENVPGFFGSAGHQQLLDVLQRLGSPQHDVLVCPTQLGVPYRRPRHYTLARLGGSPLSSSATQQLQQLSHHNPAPPRLLPGAQQQPLQAFLQFCWGGLSQPLGQVSDEAVRQQVARYALPCRRVSRYHRVLDVVTPASPCVNCFTKGYARDVRASGSFLLPSPAAQQLCQQDDRGRWHFTRDPYTTDSLQGRSSSSSTAAKSPYSSRPDADDECLQLEQVLPPALRLRRFTPGEVAALQGFPPDFASPPGISDRQAYQLLGNSISVDVVAYLASLLLEDVLQQQQLQAAAPAVAAVT